MNKQLEEEAYRLCQSHCLVDKYDKAESDAMDAMLEFVKSDVVKQFHTKEARELIEELKTHLELSQSQLPTPIQRIHEKSITKAEKFLSK